MPNCVECGKRLLDAWHWTGVCFKCARKRLVTCPRCKELVNPKTHSCVHKKPVG